MDYREKTTTPSRKLWGTQGNGRIRGQAKLSGQESVQRKASGPDGTKRQPLKPSGFSLKCGM